jgi:polyhydroxyalkanoate synthesis regulator phasin
MTSTERQQLHKAMSRAQERALVREAITEGTVHGSISRQLGDELIEAARETVKAWHERRNTEARMARAIDKLEHLVGRP